MTADIKEKKIKNVQNVRGKIRKKHSARYWELWSMCILPLVWIFVFKYLTLGGLVIAFKDYKFARGIFGSAWCGLKNFEIAFHTSDFARVTWNTLSMNLLFIVFGKISAVLVAVLLYNLRSRKATKVYQTVMITPHFLSWVIVSYMVYAILNPSYGLMNQILEAVGLQAVDWYSIPWAWTWILMIANIWKHVGMDCVLYYAALMGMDSSLLEAADIDGANRVQKTVKIMLPELVPVVTITVILAIGGIFHADFGLFYQVPRNMGILYPRTDVIDTYVFRLMQGTGDFGLSTAIGLMQSCVGCILVLVTNAVVRKVSPENALL